MDRAAASETFRFKRPYKTADHGTSENGLNWADGHFDYKQLHHSYYIGRGRFRALVRLRRLLIYIPRRTDGTADP